MKKTILTTPEDLPYRKLQQHLDRQPVGFPPSADGADIRLLKHVFSPEEAAIATCLSHEPQTVEEIFDQAIHMVSSMDTLKKRLTAMVKKGGIEFYQKNNQNVYANVPLVVGIYELQVNRLTPEFIRDFKAYTSEKRFGISFLGTGRSQMRTIPVNKSIAPDLPAAEYDQILCLLEKADPPFVVLPCICRKKKALQGMPCKQTRREETCMAMGSIAQTLIKMELGRQITKAELMEVINRNQEEGLVLQPSNTRKIEFLCSCCGCCCSMLSLHKELPLPLDFWETGFRAELSTDSCAGCGQCADKCPVQALSFLELANEQKKKARPFIDPDRCIGCGQCVAVCRPGALSLIPRPWQIPPPINRKTLNAELLAYKQQPLARTRVIGKLAKGIIVKRDFRLLKN
jgi:ferredoxin